MAKSGRFFFFLFFLFLPAFGGCMSDLFDFDRVQEGNIGRTSDGLIVPAAAGTKRQGEPVTLLQFSGDPNDPQVVTVSIAAIQQTNGKGPFVALLQWAAGLGQLQQAEIDIPTNDISQTTSGAFPYTPGGGLMVSFVGSSFEVKVRNDASFGPNNGDPLGLLGSAGVQFTASAGIGSHAGAGAPPLRTIWGIHVAAGLAAGAGAVLMAVPPFARRFRVFRSEADNPIDIRQVDVRNAIVDGPYNVAAFTAAPQLELTGSTTFISVRNNGGATTISNIATVFELGGI